MNSKSITSGEDIVRGKNLDAVRVSKNISTAKGFSALIVMAGHIGTGIPNYWVVVAVAMLIFTISSGYFTWLKYCDDFQWKQFWYRKILRLIPRLIIIELFLLCIFIVKDSQGLWTWDTAMYIIPGLPGFLSWFHVPNQSPYGLGMWYLSLLLIFYALYPVISRIYYKIGALVTTVIIILCLFVLHLKIVYGHALWLTAAGFFIGIFLASCKFRLSTITAVILTAFTAMVMVVSHEVFKFDSINFFFILTIASGGILFFFEVELPKIITFAGGWLSGLLLEIYLLHPYLSIHPTGIYRLDQVFTVLLVLLVAWLLVALNKVIGLMFSSSELKKIDNVIR